MHVAKIEGNNVKIYDAKTGAIKRTIGVPDGAVSTEISGDMISITTKKGRVKVYDLKTGALKRTF